MNGIHEVTGSIPVWSTIFDLGALPPDPRLAHSFAAPPLTALRRGSLRSRGSLGNASLAPDSACFAATPRTRSLVRLGSSKSAEDYGYNPPSAADYPAPR